MIVTVTANAAIDRTLHVAQLRPGRRQQVLRDHAQAGGKGLNVARVLRALGEPVRAIVVVGGAPGAWILEDLARSGLEASPVWAGGESRTCLEIVDAAGQVTQLHGAGVAADAHVAEALLGDTDQHLAGAAWLALCGSLAPGLPDDTYARLVERARRRGVAVAVDTSGAALAAAWRAGPDLVRVNREEAAQALGLDPMRLDLATAGRTGSCRLVVISDGPRPVLARSADGMCWRADPPAIVARNPVGCGDAMLAGLLHARSAGRSVADALRTGVALGAADAEAEAAGCADPRRARTLEACVRVARREEAA